MNRVLNLSKPCVAAVPRTTRSLPKRIKAKGANDCVYLTNSPYLPFVKIGCWSNTLGALQSRYRVYYGHDIMMYTFSVQNMKAGELALKDKFMKFHLSGELYKITKDMPLSTYVKEAANLLAHL